MSVRADYVAALRVERTHLERQPNPNTARIAQVDRELSRYESEPAAELAEVEAAVPGPISRRRKPQAE